MRPGTGRERAEPEIKQASAEKGETRNASGWKEGFSSGARRVPPEKEGKTGGERPAAAIDPPAGSRHGGRGKATGSRLFPAPGIHRRAGERTDPPRSRSFHESSGRPRGRGCPNGRRISPWRGVPGSVRIRHTNRRRTDRRFRPQPALRTDDRRRSRAGPRRRRIPDKRRRRKRKSAAVDRRRRFISIGYVIPSPAGVNGEKCRHFSPYSLHDGPFPQQDDIGSDIRGAFPGECVRRSTLLFRSAAEQVGDPDVLGFQERPHRPVQAGLGDVVIDDRL